MSIIKRFGPLAFALGVVGLVGAIASAIIGIFGWIIGAIVLFFTFR